MHAAFQMRSGTVTKQFGFPGFEGGEILKCYHLIHFLKNEQINENAPNILPFHKTISVKPLNSTWEY